MHYGNFTHTYKCILIIFIPKPSCPSPTPAEPLFFPASPPSLWYPLLCSRPLLHPSLSASASQISSDEALSPKDTVSLGRKEVMIHSASLISFHPSWGPSLDYQGSEGDHNDTILVNGKCHYDAALGSTNCTFLPLSHCADILQNHLSYSDCFFKKKYLPWRMDIIPQVLTLVICT